MALHAATEWDVRTTGNDANGGGFQVGIADGVDLSQQDAAEHAYTDLVIDHTTNTKITSVARPFTVVDKGNIINITAGTGFTVQRVQITAVDGSNIATCDKAVGTIDSTGGTGNLGGALLTPAAAAALVVASNKVHIKAGTYTITTAIGVNGAVSHQWIGFNATHSDGGTKPLITTATNSTVLFRYTANSDTTTVTFRNLSLSNTAATRSDGIRASTGNQGQLVVEDCILDGFAKGINGDFGTDTYFWVYSRIARTEIKNCTTQGVNNRYKLYVQGCYIHDCVTGITVTSGATDGSAWVELIRSVVTDQTTGLNLPANMTLRASESTIANNSGDGVAMAATPVQIILDNCIFYGNGGYGVNAGAAPTRIASVNYCALGGNTPADLLNLTAGVGTVTLTADPFTNAAGGDYSLNSDAGGGAACRDAGFQWGD